MVLVDANHILGSVMFFFKGYFGSVLHTGDFRWSRHLLRDNSYLFHEDATMKFPVDELIMDNTYCDPIFKFPAQVGHCFFCVFCFGLVVQTHNFRLLDSYGRVVILTKYL